jgi:hypothetical protein
MIATPAPAQPELVTVSAILFIPEEGKFHMRLYLKLELTQR